MNKLTLTALLAFTTTPAFASETVSKYEQAEIDQEIASCVAEVASHADYRGARQVRHEVVVTPRRAIGHKLDIRTSVLSEDEVIRAYTTRCVAYRGNRPVRFRIRELGADAGL